MNLRCSGRFVGASLAGIVFALAAVGGHGCSSDDGRQDKYYNSDAAAGYGGPEAGYLLDSSTQSDKDADAGDDGSLQNSDAAAKDTNGSADASADVEASDAVSTQ